MTSNKNIRKTIPPKSVNPFEVPEGYFEGLHGKVMEKIDQMEMDQHADSKKIHLRPYLALVASISGLALIVYVLVQSLMGSRFNDYNSYDLATLDQLGIISDEYIVAESLNESEESEYTEWEASAMSYLASNEVDLFQLIESN